MKYIVARSLLLLALCVFILPIQAAEDDTTKKKTTYEVEVVKDLDYHGGKEADSERHKLDLYLPKGAKDYPVLFYIHGGGWTKGSKASFSSQGKTFASQGIGCVSVNYRLTSKHPSHIEDVARAFAFSVKELKKRGADVGRVFVSGHSAGGHLAALLAVDDGYLKKYKLSPAENIKGVIPISGVFTIREGNRSFGDAEACKAASPQTHVKEKLPPFLIFYGDAEAGALGRQAESFGKALKGARCNVTVKMIADRNHGTIMRNIAKEDDPVTVQIVEFIKKNGAVSTKGE